MLQMCIIVSCRIRNRLQQQERPCFSPVLENKRANFVVSPTQSETNLTVERSFLESLPWLCVKFNNEYKSQLFLFLCTKENTRSEKFGAAAITFFISLKHFNHLLTTIENAHAKVNMPKNPSNILRINLINFGTCHSVTNVRRFLSFKHSVKRPNCRDERKLHRLKSSFVFVICRVMVYDVQIINPSECLMRMCVCVCLSLYMRSDAMRIN